jgi:acyl-CoA thioester hydrolase
MVEHWHEIRVRYAETDQMGVVHHSRYAVYLEEARTQAMRDFGIPYSSLEAAGVALPLMSLESKFIKSAKYDDVIKIKTTIPKMPTVRMEIEYEIFVEDVLINTSKTTLVFTDKNNLKPIRCPQEVLDNLSPHFS